MLVRFYCCSYATRIKNFIFPIIFFAFFYILPSRCDWLFHENIYFIAATLQFSTRSASGSSEDLTVFLRGAYYTGKQPANEIKEGGGNRIVLYLDMLIGLNFVFSYLLLSVTNYLAKAGKRKRRLFFGAGVATSLIPLYVYFPNSMLNSVWMKGVYSLLIVYSTFGYQHFQAFFQRLRLFYLTTFAVGGGLTGIYYMMGTAKAADASSSIWYVTNMQEETMHIGLFVIGFPFVLYTFRKMLDRQVKNKLQYDQMYRVTLALNGKEMDTTGFIDSGNQLTDPLTGRPVVLCDASYIRKFFAEDVWRQIETAILMDDLSSFPETWQQKLALIPYQGAAGQSGCLYSIKPDKLEIDIDGESVVTDHVWIGIQLGQLSANDAYHCLLQPELLQLHMGQTA